MLNHVSSICLRETFLLMIPNCLTNAKTCLSSYENRMNQIQVIVKCWNIKDGQKIAKFYFSVMGHYANVERCLSLMQPQT